MGAVNRPDELTVPAVAVHVTAVFDEWVTVAVNCRVVPEVRVTFAGDAETVTPPLLLGNDDDDAPPPQDTSNITAETMRPKSIRLTKAFSRPDMTTLSRNSNPRAGECATTKDREASGRLAGDIPMPSSKAWCSLGENRSEGVTEGQ